MQEPGFPVKLVIPVLYAIALLIPFTSQFFIPATPVFAYLLSFYSNRFIPEKYRPTVSVSLLPTLESVLYGANISDILTRFTHPVLDLIAWLPYGVFHYTFPFFVAAFVWLFRPKEVLHLWARTLGYMNLFGVFVQIVLPCSAPWYELIYGLTPATYATRGSAGGLARIDTIFHSHGYAATFSNSPLVFGAFPSLHSACATLEALFLSHFFPWSTPYVWGYAGVLYWSTMYLTHHYLIDVVCGACLAIASFYLFLPDEMRGTAGSPMGPDDRSKQEIYDLEASPALRRRRELDGELSKALLNESMGDEIPSITVTQSE
jgi:membrane-associated phospholipid phosphatase